MLGINFLKKNFTLRVIFKLNSILGLLKNEINYENLSEFLIKESEDYKIINFAKVVKMNYSKISDAQKNLIYKGFWDI